MNKILTLTIGEGSEEKTYSTAWISMYHTKAISKINKELISFSKKAQEIATTSSDLTSRSNEIKEIIAEMKTSKTGIVDVFELNKLVEEDKRITNEQLEITEYLTDKTEEFWERKLNIIHEVFRGQFEQIDLEKNKSSQEINEIFQQVSDFTNGIVRKN